MEWIRDRIMPIPGLKERRQAVASMSNMVFRESGAQGSVSPLALIVAADSDGVASGLHRDILSALGPEFDSMGLNRTAMVWVYDSDHRDMPGLGSERGWIISPLSRDNSTTMEELISIMLSDMQVGVLYINSASVILTMGRRGLLSEVISMDAGEDVGIMPSQQICIHWGRMTDFNGTDLGEDLSTCTDTPSILEPPVTPLIDTSLLLAWPTTGSRGLFKDAEDWVRAHGSMDIPGKSSFAINVLCNSRRDGEVQEVPSGEEGDQQQQQQPTLVYRLIRAGQYVNRIPSEVV